MGWGVGAPHCDRVASLAAAPRFLFLLLVSVSLPFPHSLSPEDTWPTQRLPDTITSFFPTYCGKSETGDSTGPPPRN